MNNLQAKELDSDLMDKKTDFTGNVFNELRNFTVEYQIEILRDLYFRLEKSYISELDIALENVSKMKETLDVLRTINPDAKKQDYDERTPSIL